MQNNNYTFKKAIPVWEKGTEVAINRALVFVSKLGKVKDCKLAIAGSTAFTVLVNGDFVAYGPARAGHGYYRVDEYC